MGYFDSVKLMRTLRAQQMLAKPEDPHGQFTKEGID